MGREGWHAPPVEAHDLLRVRQHGRGLEVRHHGLHSGIHPRLY